jgi:hypothetical protein
MLPRTFVALMLVMLVSGLCLGRAALGHAQMLDPTAFEQAYLTADPIDPGRLGLATPAGRYAIRPVQGCDGLGVGQNVLIWPSLNLPPWLSVAPAEWDLAEAPPCLVRIEGRMDATPCFTNDAGLCDVALES